tara:strand:+ start:49 stop:576 length:528 start_codon:yes stop_codon:yes gene_type:complete
MVLYQLSGWEGSSYCTHTAFFATSLDEAEQLCNELFDKLHPTYCQHILKLDILREEKNELYDIENKIVTPLKIEIARIAKMWDFKRHGVGEGSKHLFYKINLVNKVADIQKEYSKKRDDLDHAFHGEFITFDEYFCNALGFDETLDKEYQVKAWLKMLHKINANALEFMCEQNGD